MRMAKKDKLEYHLDLVSRWETNQLKLPYKKQLFRQDSQRKEVLSNLLQSGV